MKACNDCWSVWGSDGNADIGDDGVCVVEFVVDDGELITGLHDALLPDPPPNDPRWCMSKWCLMWETIINQ